MPRKTSTVQPGIRKYGTKSNYTAASLQEALDQVKAGVMSMKRASKEYNIPRTTIYYKLTEKHSKKVGRPVTLTIEEEIILRDHLLTLSDIGIAITMHDFNAVVKNYLDKTKKTIPHFKNNKPGWEWGKLFLLRHPILKEKIAQTISRKRAQVDEAQVKGFFENLSREIDGVLPENIYNVDESGFHDNPGKKKLIFRRTTRHPDIVRNSTKSCYTLVCCGNAMGELLPPFFIFKGKTKWSDWLMNAPAGSRMSVSDSGWIDSEIWEEWLENHFLPVVNKKPGKKMLLCDNLSAHLSVKSLRLCEENNISFICLVPNATHLLQPLDVGYFSPLKTQWRKILSKWRQTCRGKKHVGLPKNLFAQLIDQTLKADAERSKPNLVAGFKSSGIYPMSLETVLEKLPLYARSNVQEAIQDNVGESFKEYLHEIRNSDLNNIIRAKKFRLPVTAGKSVSAEEVENYYRARSSVPDVGSSKKRRGRPAGIKNKNKNQKMNLPGTSNTSSTKDTTSATVSVDVGEKQTDQDLQIPGPCVPTVISLSAEHMEDDNVVVAEYIVDNDGTLLETVLQSEFKVDAFCIVRYEGTLFPGRICKTEGQVHPSGVHGVPMAGPLHGPGPHVGPPHAGPPLPGPDGENAQHGPRRHYTNRPRIIKNVERLPLDEAARREMASLSMKTPVSVLQELLARRGTCPKYELVQIEGMIHEPTFRYRVTIADIIAIGTGRSKKEAKHSAARALLEKLTGNAPTEPATNGTIPEPVNTIVSAYEGNPVGWLQELCMSRMWPPPNYVSEVDDNTARRMPHDRMFTVVCLLMKRREVGTGKSKKLAKRQAAYKMWQALQDNPPDPGYVGDEEGLRNVSTRYADLKDSKISTLTTSHSHKVSQFHKHLKSSTGPNLAKLQVTALNNKDFNFVQFLQEIAAEQTFEVTYVDIEEKSMTGCFQCLVQLSTLPVAVCYGSGLTSKDAQASAAHNALEYLKIMTKK